MNPEKSLPTVEIRIPISATEKYLRMVHYFLESLQQFGGPISRSAKCVVSVSRDEPYRDLRKEYPWVSNYNVEFLWIDEGLFKKHGYHGTLFHRLNVKSEADIVILADADLLVTNDFDQTILDAFTDQKLLGFIAHVSPFGIKNSFNGIPSKIWWKKIFDEAGLPPPLLNCVHTGWSLFYKDKRHSSCPYYFNYGFIVSPKQYIEQIGQSFISELDIIERVLETDFKSQIANTICIKRHGISCGTLPLNYNFPLNVPDDKIRALNPDPKGENSADDVKIFHYLGNSRIPVYYHKEIAREESKPNDKRDEEYITWLKKKRFNKEDFQTIKSLESALRRKNLSEAEIVFQRKLRFIHEKIMSKPNR